MRRQLRPKSKDKVRQLRPKSKDKVRKRKKIKKVWRRSAAGPCLAARVADNRLIHVLDVVDLVHRGAPHLTDALGDPVHAVQVGLAQLAAVGVAGEVAAVREVVVVDEGHALARLAFAASVSL